MQTGFVLSSPVGPDFGVHAGGRYRAAAPALDAQGKAQGSASLPILDVRKPANGLGRQAKVCRTLGESEASGLTVFGEQHTACSPQVNIASSIDFHFGLTDTDSQFSHDLNMAAPDRPLWYLQEWFATQQRIQRDLITKLDWLPAKANKVWHGVQIAKLDEVAEIADLLQIAPWELLMPPEEAMKLRRIRSVLAEVATPDLPADTHASSSVRTGTSR